MRSFACSYSFAPRLVLHEAIAQLQARSRSFYSIRRNVDEAELAHSADEWLHIFFIFATDSSADQAVTSDHAGLGYALHCDTCVVRLRLQGVCYKDGDGREDSMVSFQYLLGK
jgi:hypothetical protein